MSTTLQVGTFNARGLSDKFKRRETFLWLKRHKCNIVLLQETHSVKETEFIWKAEWRGKIYCSHGTSQSRGTAILIKNDLDFKTLEVERDEEGRYVMAKIEIEKKTYLIVSVYGPNNDDPQFFCEVFRQIQRFSVDHIIVGGDFNTVLDYTVDKSDMKKHKNNSAADYINGVLEVLEFVDIWRELHPDRHGYTWRRSRLHERLDWILISAEIQQMVTEIRVLPGYRSDHDMVVLKIEVESFKRGPGFWKLNTSLLRDKDYVEKMNKLLDIEMSSKKYYDSKKKHWEIIKFAIQNSTRQFSISKKRDRDNRIQVLERKLNFHTSTESVLGWDATDQVKALKTEIEELYAIKAQGAILRSKADWIEYGSKPTKYFLNLEKSNYNKKVMHRIQDSKGALISGRTQVLEEMTQYYKNLYTQENEDQEWDVDSYLNDKNIPKLPNDIKQMMENPVEMKELTEALKLLKHGKTPGNDGLPPEFYIVFWSKIKEFFHELILEVIQTKEMHLTARRGVITLIEKRDRDPKMLKSWRPISLLNTDLKIYSKVIALRIQVTRGTLIHESQTGFQKGKLIGENVIKILNMMDYCENNKKSAVLISFDFEKAFDKVSWKAIFGALKAFNFGEYFIDLVRILYEKPISCVLNGGYTGQYFELSRSTRQGDPSSALLFTLVVEILGIKIRTNAEIKGIKIDNYEIKAAQYADDLWTILEPTVQNINNLLKEMEKFRKFSGLHINADKSAATILGPLRETDAKFYTLKKLFWTRDTMKILGINIHPDPEVVFASNYVETLNKVQKILQVWKQRKLSITGKIALINSLVVSQFMYKFMALPSPGKIFFNSYKCIILDFIWDGKKPRIRYDKLIQNHENGGLKLMDLETKNLAMKVKWLQYMKGKEAPWFYINSKISSEKQENMWRCNFKYEDVNHLFVKAPFNFLKEIAEAWSKYNYEYPQELKEMSNQIIWFNSNIRRAGLPLRDEFVNTGIQKVHQLLTDDTNEIRNYVQYKELENSNLSMLKYYALKAAVPIVWKQNLKRAEQSEIKKCIENGMYKYDKIDVQIVRKVYWELIEQKKRADGANLAWNIDLRINVPLEEFQKLYINVQKITLSDVLREFQYKILTRSLTTNRKRHIWDRDVSPLCTMCNQRVETIIHLLVECEEVKKLWYGLERWIDHFMKIKVTFTPEIIIFNKYQGKQSELMNTLVLIMKRYVYVQKCKKKTLSFQGYISHILYVKRIESFIAFRKQKSTKHDKKWKNFL